MRSAVLDMLRFVAVLLVLGRHMTASMIDLGGAFTRTWFQVGWIGVDLFFVLSGYLVGGLLMAEVQRFGNIRIGRFLLRRGFKIYPAFYAMILATIVLGPMVGTRVSSGGIVAECFFIQNYKGPLWDHTWSLAVEEHFYILLPLTIGLLVRRGTTGVKRLPWVVLGVCVALLALRIARAWMHAESGRDFEYAPLVYRTHVRIDSLALGVLLAYAKQFYGPWLSTVVNQRRAALWITFAVCGASAFIWPIQSPIMHSIGFTVLGVGFACLLLVTAVVPRGGGTTNIAARAAAFLGKHSYSVYLWHLPWRDWMRPLVLQHWGGVPTWAELVIYVIGAFAIGVVLGKLIEWPMLAVRDRWVGARQLETQPRGNTRASPDFPAR